MTVRSLAVSLMAGVMMTAVCGAGAQAGPKPAAAYKAPRTHFGAPDLQGTWNNNFATRLQRDPKLGDRAILTPAEASAMIAAMDKATAEQDKPTALDAPAETACKLDCPYANSSWSERPQLAQVKGEVRTSYITFPSNGRLPPMTPQAKAREALIKERNKDITPTGGAHLAPVGGTVNDNPETRTLAERCLSTFGNHAGPVMMGGGYNSNYIFMQSKDKLSIVVEMPHDQRIVRIGGVHPPANVRVWNGDSIGRWEGDTLVVDTANFRADQTDFNFSSMVDLKVEERFTRVGPDRLLYQFKVTDPDTWTQPWGGEYEFVRSQGPFLEYACHEGNYGLAGILAGAREEEKVAAAGTGTAPARP